MASGAQWFAIFSASTGDLVSVGDSVTFPLNPGLRAVTVDGDKNGRYWDKVTLNFTTTPPPPPPPPPRGKVICDASCDCRTGTPAGGYPFAEEWGTIDLVFTGHNGATATVSFPHGKFTVPPMVAQPVVSNVTHPARGGSYLVFQVGQITTTGFTIYARALAPLNYTETVTWHAIQRTKEKA